MPCAPRPPLMKLWKPSTRVPLPSDERCGSPSQSSSITGFGLGTAVADGAPPDPRRHHPRDQGIGDRTFWPKVRPAICRVHQCPRCRKRRPSPKPCVAHQFSDIKDHARAERNDVSSSILDLITRRCAVGTSGCPGAPPPSPHGRCRTVGHRRCAGNQGSA